MRHISKKSILPVLIASLILVLASCKKTTNENVCNPSVPVLGNEVPFSILSDTVVRDGLVFCRIRQAEWGPQYGYNMVVDPQTDVIYPFSVLQYKNPQDGTYTPVVGKRRPVTISISLPNIGVVSQTIENPTLSTIREAIQRILQSRITGNTPAQISWQSTEIYSRGHLELSFAANGGSIFYDISGSYQYGSSEVKGRFLLQFTQTYYSIDADLPQPGIQNLFDQRIGCSQLSGAPPVYVSSVKYGRKVFLMIESSTYNYSHKAEIQASFDAFFASGGASAQTVLQKLVTERSIKAVIMGGPADQGIQAITSLTGLKNYLLAGANFNASSPGVPLGYTLRFISDNSVAKLSMYDKFTIRECEVIPPVTSVFQPAPISEIRLNHILGNKDFGGNGPDVKLKVDLYLSTNKKEVWARVDLKMAENCCDHSTGSRIYEVKLWTCPSNKRINSIISASSQTFEYTDNDILYDKYDFPVSSVASRLEFLGDTAGDDLDLSDIESTGHLHKLLFNKISVGLVDN